MDQQENYGYLLVRASSAFGSIPISGATVSVRTANGEDSTLHMMMVTNEDGETEVIPIPAPPAENSLKSGGAMPYSLVNLEIFADGYYSVSVQNIPIFAGIKSTQNINMIPLPESAWWEKYPNAHIFITESEAPNL
jgi:hypothetical protein